MKTQNVGGKFRTEKGTRARALIGHSMDLAIKEIVDKFPGLSLYEIQKLVNSSLGLVDGSIRRLEKNGSVRVRRVLRGGKSVKEVIPSTYLENNNSEVIIDKDAFPNPDVRGNTIYLYALNRSSIGVSPTVEEVWKSEALFEAQVNIKKDDRRIVFDVPVKFKNFYLWENSQLDISVVDELVILNLSTVIPVVESNSAVELVDSHDSLAKNKVTLSDSQGNDALSPSKLYRLTIEYRRERISKSNLWKQLGLTSR